MYFRKGNVAFILVRLICFCMAQFLTRNEWYVIPLIWLPVVCWYTSKSFKMGHTLPQIAIILVMGIFVWSLLEYTLHRFLFHIKTKSYWCVLFLYISCTHFRHGYGFYSLDFVNIFRGNTLHYLLHGCHHKHPQDGLRLVFPPTATAILLVPVRSLRVSPFQYFTIQDIIGSLVGCAIVMPKFGYHTYIA